ncbi:MAG TPA: ABC transporter permease, partial [Methylomirabilota bacterium]|nr:ABC transporter permease [Methylomirabilota bacterium]
MARRPMESSVATPVITINASRGWTAVRMDQLWEYRELLYFLIWRDVKVRYKQTALGASWAIIQPFFTMVVFSLFFGKLAKVASDGVPYPIFSFTALVPWTFFANGLTQSSQSLVASSQLVRKIYFPRLIIPFSSMLHSLVDYFFSCVVLALVMAWFQFYPDWRALALPGLTFLTLLTATGVGLWFAALNVRYRDVTNIVGILIQVG